MTADPNVLKPTFPAGWLSDTTLASQCQTITVRGAAFSAVAPQTADLSYLAHCRAVRSAEEGEILLSVLLSNRLAVADSRQAPAAPLRYYAHLVSLEGYAGYLGPDGSPIPYKSDGSGPMDVQLVSLTNWSFVSLPEIGAGFTQLMQGLIDSEQTTPALRLPVSNPAGIAPAVLERLQNGYAPLTFVTGIGEQSFAWYRGPFTPVVAQALPPAGAPPVDTRHVTNADALMIYLAREGMFDLSYAAAWNTGRGLALADSRFAQLLNGYRQAANAALGRLSQRLTQSHFSGYADLRALATPQATRQHFSGRIGAGLGRGWTQALASARAGARPAADRAYRPLATTRRAPIRPRDVLQLPGAADAVSENVQDELDAIAAWLANISLLLPVPFSHLVPEARMLPTESIRFFYVDQGWIDAAIAGALSLAVHGSADLALLSACRPRLHLAVRSQRARLSAGPLGTSSIGSGCEGVTGMLIRSQLIADWPSLVVAPTLGGAPLSVIRDDRPAPAVRLVLFAGVPDMISLAEPYQGLQFGIEEGKIQPRCVTLPTAAGVQIDNVPALPVAPSLRTAAPGAVGGVLQVADLASRLASAAGVLPFAAGAVVQWNGQSLSMAAVNSRQLQAKVPAALVASPGSAAITVTSAGATSAPATFTIEPPLAIDGLAPAVAAAGAASFTLTVHGVGFVVGAVVQWNDTPLDSRVVSTMELSAAVPAALLAVPATVAIAVASGGATSQAAAFTVMGANPGIDCLEPNLQSAGTSGFTLTVLGSGFTPDSQVEWNGAVLATRIVTPGLQLAAVVPASLIATPGTASIVVSGQTGASPPATLTIAGPGPALGSLKPAVVIVGGKDLTLIVDGVNFSADAKVYWNSTPLATTWDDAVQVTAVVPAALLKTAGAQAITVLSGGSTSNAVPFSVIAPQPCIGLLEPAVMVAGAADFILTVTRGFGSGDFALQLVRAPELQSFIPVTAGQPGLHS
ncbi:MAG TPA: IPT/TIG domain-containing protein [Burkholderiaceae bacterium]|nr:IPT/TIG domain-containing protein [Burkholderiaceae bacterium]